MEPRSESADETHERVVAMLDKVTLDYFTSDPATIAPYGSSLLKWKVNGAAEVRIDFDWGLENAGSKTVQPQSSHTYRLYAYLDNDSKFLGSVAVNVNLGRCVSLQDVIVAQALKYALQTEIDDATGVYFRVVPKQNSQGAVTYGASEPEIMVTPGQIRFILKLGAYLDNGPNPDIDIDASFGLDVVASDTILAIGHRRKVVPIKIDVNVSVSVPWYVWLIPGANTWLPDVLSAAEDQARQRIEASIPRLVADGIVGRIAKPAGLEPHSVRINEGGFNNQGVVEFTYCPVERPPATQSPR